MPEVAGADGPPALSNVTVAGFPEFMGRFAGCSFNGGIYRVPGRKGMAQWTEIARRTFPDFAGRILCCFSYDWLGRQFALDGQRMENGEPMVLMIDPGVGEILDIPCNFANFHNNELVEYEDEALASEMFRAWRGSGQPGPGHNECVAHKVPLFLGGADELDNYELTDMSVCWELAGQLLAATKGLPEGTKIGSIKIE